MKKSRRTFAGAVAALVILLHSVAPVRAELRIDITSGKVEPMPIALPPLPGSAANESQAGRDIAGVVSADLERSGLFRPLDPRSFIQNISVSDAQPRFPDWRQINAQALVTGSVKTQGDGRLRVEFRLWDIFAEQQLAGFGYTTTQQNWRRIAHIIADEIYKRITGEEGYFDTRIVYVSETGPQDKRIKRLAIMDQDGANNRLLTDGRALVLTPRFSPTAQEITYLS
jgi:TolB protein